MIDRRLGLDELGDAFGSEVNDALEMGRFLQASIDETTLDLPAVEARFGAPTEASGGLSDRVMAALADEPAPTPVGFLLPLRRRGFLHGLWASFRQASVATRGAGRPLLARSAALAYVLVVASAGLSLTGVATIGTAGALGLLGPAATQSPVPTPLVPPPPGPTVVPPTQLEPSLPPPSTAPTPPAPSPSPTESDDHGGNSGPGGGGAGPTDDHGGNSGPGGGGSDDGGNSGPGSSGSGAGSGSGSDSGSGSGSGSGKDDAGPSPTPDPGSHGGSGPG